MCMANAPINFLTYVSRCSNWRLALRYLDVKLIVRRKIDPLVILFKFLYEPLIELKISISKYSFLSISLLSMLLSRCHSVIDVVALASSFVSSLMEIRIQREMTSLKLFLQALLEMIYIGVI